MSQDDRPVVKILVLETDETDPETNEERGGYGHILSRHFKKAGNEHKPPLGVEVHRTLVVEDKGGRVPTVEDVAPYDAILLTGSMYDAHAENVEWIDKLLALLKELWVKRKDVRLSGVCFGHQLICRMLGATIKRASEGKWEIGHSRIDLSPVGVRLFQADKKSPYVYMHQMHQDHVAEPPCAERSGGLLDEGTRVHVWGHSEHTKVQGVFIADRVFTTQAHVAFDEEMVHRELEMRVDEGALTNLDHVDRAKDTAHLEHDGDVVAEAILRFYHGDDHGFKDEDSDEDELEDKKW